VKVTLGAKQMTLGATGMLVRPLLMSGGKQVGGVGMVVNAELDGTTGCVKLEPNRQATLAFHLTDASATAIRIVMQDPTSDADLYRSPADIPVRLTM